MKHASASLLSSLDKIFRKSPPVQDAHFIVFFCLYRFSRANSPLDIKPPVSSFIFVMILVLMCSVAFRYLSQKLTQCYKRRLKAQGLLHPAIKELTCHLAELKKSAATIRLA